MKKSEIIALTEYGCGLCIDASKFTYAELRQMARATRKSGGSLVIHNADEFFTAEEILIIAQEGNRFVTFHFVGTKTLCP